MSANFTGVTFPNQKVTPANDAVIRRAIFDDGILTGCDLSYSGSTLTMTAGQLMICGRQIIHPSSQNWAVTEATSGYARLVLTIDVTRTSTKDTFDQVVDEIQYATDANGFADLTTADINATGTRYQVAVCVVSLGPGGITGIVSKLDVTEGGGAGGVLTVTVSPGELVTVSNGDKSQAKAANASGVAVFKGLKAGAWTVAVTRNGKPTAKTVIIVTDYSVSIPLSTIPEFTYTGDYEIVNDSDETITESQDNWKIRFLTSGTLTFTNLNGAENGIDVFLVGGGGDGGPRQWNPDSNIYQHGAGGGSGYTTTEKGVTLTTGAEYQIEIGAATGSTSAFSLSASGGNNAGTVSRGWQDGGNGASGGGATNGVGGADGSNGTAPNFGTAGTGQGTTTREFGEENGRLYATGGNGSGTTTLAEANSGNGADGRDAGDASASGNPGASGIVVIRNAREVA
nr:MAG TPA: Receptor Binding Protein sandwich domain, phage receptor.75A [Caudoviricetes sp.]